MFLTCPLQLSLIRIHRYKLLDEAGREEPLITHARHRAHLENALLFLNAFLDSREQPFYLRITQLPQRNFQPNMTLSRQQRNFAMLLKPSGRYLGLLTSRISLMKYFAASALENERHSLTIREKTNASRLYTEY